MEKFGFVPPSEGGDITPEIRAELDRQRNDREKQPPSEERKLGALDDLKKGRLPSKGYSISPKMVEFMKSPEAKRAYLEGLAGTLRTTEKTNMNRGDGDEWLFVSKKDLEVLGVVKEDIVNNQELQIAAQDYLERNLEDLAYWGCLKMFREEFGTSSDFWEKPETQKKAKEILAKLKEGRGYSHPSNRVDDAVREFGLVGIEF